MPICVFDWFLYVMGLSGLLVIITAFQIEGREIFGKFVKDFLT